MIENPNFWICLGFIVFGILIFKRLQQFIVTTLDQYIASVRDKIDHSTTRRLQAQQDLIACQHYQTQILQQIQDINIHAQLEVERLMQKSRADMATYLKNEEHLINDRMRRYELKILKDIEQQAIKIALQACQNLLLQSVPTTAQTQSLQQTLQAVAHAHSKITFH